MDIQLLTIGVFSLIGGVLMMIRYRFYKYKISDALFDTKLRVFMGSLILTITGIIIVINELKKLS